MATSTNNPDPVERAPTCLSALPDQDRLRADSLVLFRRELTARIILAMIAAAGPVADGPLVQYSDPARTAEDLANALCERLAARETGDPKGYGR